MPSKFKCRGLGATSTYDFSTLYTTLPHNLIKEKLLDLIAWISKRALKNYGSLYLACNDRKAFFTASDHFGHVRMYATPYPISWIISIFVSEPSYTDKLLECLGVQIAPLS